MKLMLLVFLFAIIIATVLTVPLEEDSHRQERAICNNLQCNSNCFPRGGRCLYNSCVCN